MHPEHLQGGKFFLSSPSCAAFFAAGNELFGDALSTFFQKKILKNS